MVSFALPIRKLTSLFLVALTAFSAVFVGASEVQGKVLVSRKKQKSRNH
jgi:hypothetical protein